MNIAEILKDKPKGTKLYSTPWGKCTLEELDTFLPLLPITVRNCHDGLQKRYTKKGTYYPSLDECLLFPSKEMRDWRKFVWKVGAILVSNDGETVVMFLEWANDAYTEFVGAKFPVKKEEGKSTFNTCDFESCCQSYNIEPCINPTTGEFSVKTVRIKVGNSEPNEPNKPTEPKHEFKPFDYVLVKNEFGEWCLCQFSHIAHNGKTFFVGGTSTGDEVIPYKGNEHLLGTTKPLEYIAV